MLNRRIFMIDIIDKNDVKNRIGHRTLCNFCGNKVKKRYHHILDNYGNHTGKVCCLDGNCIEKMRSDWRNGNLDPKSSPGRGFIGQQIVAKNYGIEDCNLIMDNFCFLIDLSRHSKYGYCEVKTSSLSIKGRWGFRTDRKQEYDTLFLVCMDGNWPWKNVERVYAIPWNVAIEKINKGLAIIKRPIRHCSQWYEEFKINEKPFDDIYNKMQLKNCKVLRQYQVM